ncbi:carboxypeptidase-like regulatory domain-containing protein [Miltoncostaea oceani]|uniref:carboxypeptidase-like regulatory domain-containing protein n=1 Tax=Miltoncostaea oceani TaxID=2843216 RepID=UPI001C3E3A6A|nr:carboxypeptidase-like regulatory domain-containing protein [Miltoncostaea oceani]
MGQRGTLPNFSRIETRGIRAHQARSYSRTGRLLIPLIASTYGRPVAVSGRFLHASGRGLRGATVYLVDPKGFTAVTTRTDGRGRFTFKIRPRRSGTWRAIALDRPLVVAPRVIQLRSLVKSRIGSRSLRPGETLGVSGVIAPRSAGRRKLVKLEWRLGGGCRPRQLATADRRGRFALRYRFSPGTAAFRVPIRVVVPREKGWSLLPIVARRFDVRVR